MAEVLFLLVSGPVLKAPVLGSFRGSRGVLCATYGRYVNIVEIIRARYVGVAERGHHRSFAVSAWCDLVGLLAFLCRLYGNFWLSRLP